MGPRAAFLSFRFGPTDGVSVVARTWMAAVESFGYDVVTVSGDSSSDRTVPGIGIFEQGPDALGGPDASQNQRGPEGSPDQRGPDEDAFAAALADVDLVVVENLLTIPLNLAASLMAARLLAGRPALLHHHDPPWHRARFAHITELPASDPAWRHVTINHILAKELADRGIVADVIYNGFAVPARLSPARRAELRTTVRAAVGLGADDLVVAHPVRAIERKNLPAAISLAEQLDATYWLLGPAEEGYGPEMQRLLDGARCPVVHRPWPDAAGIYAAADHVAFPSTWEGFGNPPIEAALHRRSVSVGHYPVAAELRRFGFAWFDPDDIEGISAELADPDGAGARDRAEHNHRIAVEQFSMDRATDDLRVVFAEQGWLP